MRIINLRSVPISVVLPLLSLTVKAKGICVKFIIDQNVIEFIAKIFCDLGKAILTVGFASYFFEKLILPLRIGFIAMGIALLGISVILMMSKIRKGDN
jgi:hypothetical protein